MTIRAALFGLGLSFLLNVVGGAQVQDLPGATADHGGFGLPDQRGSRLLVIPKLDRPELLKAALCSGGRRVPVQFERRQVEGANSDGRQRWEQLRQIGGERLHRRLMACVGGLDLAQVTSSGTGPSSAQLPKEAALEREKAVLLDVGARMKKNMTDDPAPNLTPAKLVRDHLNFRIQGDTAWVTFEQHGVATGDIKFDMAGLSYETRIFEKHDGKWKVAYPGYLLAGTPAK